MSPFKTQEITPRKACIIDIGSYKIKACLCRFFGPDFEIVTHVEKRINLSQVDYKNIADIQRITKEVAGIIKKIEEFSPEKFDEIIINTPFQEIFFRSHTLNFSRNTKSVIKGEEAEKIIQKTQQKAVAKNIQDIEKYTAYKKNELHIILSSLNKILIDTNKETTLIGKQGQHISLSFLNCFIPEYYSYFYKNIEEKTKKKLLHVIPSEYAIGKAVQENTITIIHIGNTFTSITIKQDGIIIGVQKIHIGIGNYIEKIWKTYQEPKINIIAHIDDEKYFEEKQEFSTLLKEMVFLSINKILGTDDIPAGKFFFTGGGANTFVKKSFLEASFVKEICTPDENYSCKKQKDVSFETSQVNFPLLAMIQETSFYLSSENDSIMKAIQKSLKDYREED